jgi:hypothetical protein
MLEGQYNWAELVTWIKARGVRGAFVRAAKGRTQELLASAFCAFSLNGLAHQRFSFFFFF